MVSLTRSGLRRVTLGVVLALGLPLIAACDNEGPAERAGEKIDNSVSEATKQTGEAMQDVGRAIQEKSREARESLDDKSRTSN